MKPDPGRVPGCIALAAIFVVGYAQTEHPIYKASPATCKHPIDGSWGEGFSGF